MLHPLPKNRVSTLAFTTHPPRCCEDHARLVADKLANGKDGQKKPGGLRPKIAIAMAHPCLRVRSANDTCAAVRSANGFPNGSRMRKTRASSLRRLDASTVSVRAGPERPTLNVGRDNVTLVSIVVPARACTKDVLSETNTCARPYSDCEARRKASARGSSGGIHDTS